MINPVIAVPAYNRPHALARLLQSLADAAYPHDGVPLVIAIDAGGEHEREVVAVAQTFDWTHGEKTVVRHPNNIGLKGNVFYCGRLATEYGASILLEDDLSVSRQFYAFATQALARYKDDDRIGGISLNGLWFNGFNHLPFVPLLDQGDVFFLQVAWYQGQVFSAEMWQRFDAWCAQDSGKTNQPLHEIFNTFEATEWFPQKMRYLADTGRTYVFPRESHTTNWGEAGTHFSHATNWFHVPLQHVRTQFALPSLDDALAVYDTFFELLPSRLNRMTDAFSGLEYTVDFYGSKSAENIQTPHLLTTCACTKPIRSWGLEMKPFEANVAHNVGGDEIVLSAVDAVRAGRFDERIHAYKLWRYFNRRPISVRQALRLKAAQLLERKR